MLPHNGRNVLLSAFTSTTGSLSTIGYNKCFQIINRGFTSSFSIYLRDFTGGFIVKEELDCVAQTVVKRDRIGIVQKAAHFSYGLTRGRVKMQWHVKKDNKFVQPICKLN